MYTFNSDGRHFSEVNEAIRNCSDDNMTLSNVCGQRYIAAGGRGKHIDIKGIPGNALGCYMNGDIIHVHDSAQDATGDTMNDGKIIIDGNCGDATGYAMRGGRIYVRGNAGYRAGIHMKQYKDTVPAIVIGNEAGDFLGEYQAGGYIIVLGLDSKNPIPVGNFCGTGMHGGKMFIAAKAAPHDLPKQVCWDYADDDDLKEIEDILKDYCKVFSLDYDSVRNRKFIMLTPNAKSPYKQLYTAY